MRLRIGMRRTKARETNTAKRYLECAQPRERSVVPNENWPTTAGDQSDEDAIVNPVAAAPKASYEAFYERSTPGEEWTEEDLASPAFRKFLMDQLRRLASENKDLKRFREEFHTRDKRVAVLEAQTAPVSELSILSNVTLAVGGLVAGLGVSQLLSQSYGIGGAALILGVALMFSPLIARKFK